MFRNLNNAAQAAAVTEPSYDIISARCDEWNIVDPSVNAAAFNGTVTTYERIDLNSPEAGSESITISSMFEDLEKDELY